MLLTFSPTKNLEFSLPRDNKSNRNKTHVKNNIIKHIGRPVQLFKLFNSPDKKIKK